MAAQYPDWYYGQLALSELGRPMPTFASVPAPDSAERAAFEADPLTGALRAIARNRRDWRTERAFFEAIADKADTPDATRSKPGRDSAETGSVRCRFAKFAFAGAGRGGGDTCTATAGDFAPCLPQAEAADAFEPRDA